MSKLSHTIPYAERFSEFLSKIGNVETINKKYVEKRQNGSSIKITDFEVALDCKIVGLYQITEFKESPESDTKVIMLSYNGRVPGMIKNNQDEYKLISSVLNYLDIVLIEESRITRDWDMFFRKLHYQSKKDMKRLDGNYSIPFP